MVLYTTHSRLSVAIGFFLLIAQAFSKPLEQREPRCTDIVIPVTISAMNAQISELLFELLPLGTVLEQLLGSTFSFTSPVQGTYDISARYCEPEVLNQARSETLQILVHGINYDKNYWSGLGSPGASFGGTDDYSWVSYASKQGYPTLAMDRLGNGASDHPDPILVVQTPAQVEILHEIILMAKAGTIPGNAGTQSGRGAMRTRSFTKIILAGHSFGSFISNTLNQNYPNDVDVTVLTGFSSVFKTAIGSILPLGLPVPANTIIPADPTLSAGYLALDNQPGTLILFYYTSSPGVDYNPVLAAYDYDHRGTVALGEVISLLFADNPAPQYNRPVYVVTGAEEFIFCNALGLPNAANCGTSGPGYLNQTRALYPAAEVYDFYASPNSGHCWYLHNSALATFANVHGWLQGQGF